MNFIFLDIDGVLNNGNPKESGFCGFDSHCVDNFNYIIDNVKKPRVVISSSLRYLVLEGYMTLRGFEHMLLFSNIKVWGLVHGVTCSERGCPGRGNQINKYISENKIDKYVVIDDMELDIGNFVKVNGGLKKEDSYKAIKILTGEDLKLSVYKEKLSFLNGPKMCNIHAKNKALDIMESLYNNTDIVVYYDSNNAEVVACRSGLMVSRICVEEGSENIMKMFNRYGEEISYGGK